jgi:hypothetical protein
MTGDQLQKETQGIQDKSLASLQRTAQLVSQSKQVSTSSHCCFCGSSRLGCCLQVAEDVATDLERQSKQMSGVSDELSQMEDKLQKANLVSSRTQTILNHCTDQCAMCSCCGLSRAE